MKRWLRELPAVLVVGLFCHLRQSGGVDLTPSWADAYLLASWLVFVPLVGGQVQRLKTAAAHPGAVKRQAYRRLRQNHRLYADFVNGTGSLAGMLFEDGTVDSLYGGLLRFGINVLTVGLAPLLWLILTLWRKLT